MTAAPAVRPRLRWWREAAYVVAFYLVYSAIRNMFGSASVDPSDALANAERVIDLEESLGLFFELRLQEAFLDWSWFLRFWNIFYGTLHFVVTAWIMIWLYQRHPARYVRWRTTLAWTTGLALIGFATFPLMPPRLLAAGGEFGAQLTRYPFVDTLAEVGGLWSFSSGGMESISNQYAAMPSLHFGWALWCVLAAYPVLTSRWTRWPLLAYPAATLFAIVVTGNHYWIDALGGVVVLAAGWGAAHVVLQLLPAPRPVIDPAPVTAPRAPGPGHRGAAEPPSGERGEAEPPDAEPPAPPATRQKSV